MPRPEFVRKVEYYDYSCGTGIDLPVQVHLATVESGGNPRQEVFRMVVYGLSDVR